MTGMDVVLNKWVLISLNYIAVRFSQFPIFSMGLEMANAESTGRHLCLLM